MNLNKGKCVIEQKITYDGTVVSTKCRFVEMRYHHLVLFHRIVEPFTALIEMATIRC